MSRPPPVFAPLPAKSLRIQHWFARLRALGLLSSLLLLSVGAPRLARAQSIYTLNASGFDRDEPMRSTSEKPFWINREDCLADDVLHFDIKVDNPTDYNFEVWVGDADCKTKSQRIGDDAECWQVYKEPQPSAAFQIDIRVQDVVAKRPATSSSPVGTIDNCDDNWASSLTFYFMYVDDTDDVSSNVVTWTETGVDIKGPLPPSGVTAGPTDNGLVAKWSSSNSLEVLSYNIYCAPRGVGNAPDRTDSGADPSTAALDAGGTPSPDSGLDAGVGAGVDSGSDLDAGSTGPLPTTETPAVDAGSVQSGECWGEGLVPGQVPGIDAVVCGTESSHTARRGYALGLVNGSEYAVAVAAVDQLGNPGELSNVACGVPEPVTGFYEEYKGDGGEGGGGFCGLSALGQTSKSPWDRLGSWLLVSLVAWAGAVRRITRQS